MNTAQVIRPNGVGTIEEGGGGEFPDGGPISSFVAHQDAAAAGQPGAAPGAAPLGAGVGGAPAATVPGAISSGFDPSITLGPDGNVYGYVRKLGPQGYTFEYKNFGPTSDPNGVSANSGIPVGLIQSQIMQQQVTLNNLVAQGKINPLSPDGSMTQQELTQALDSVRTAQQYNSATAMQQSATPGGPTYAQMGDVTSQQNAAFQYANQPTLNQSAIDAANRNVTEYQNSQAPSAVNGMTNEQLGLQNSNQQAVQNNAYNTNYSTANPYTGLSNGQTALNSSNAGNAVNLAKDQYSLGTGPGTGGQTRLAYEQGTQDITDPYARTQATYDAATQGARNTLTSLNTAYDTAEKTNALGSADYTNGASRQGYTNTTQDYQNQYDRAMAQYNQRTAGQQTANNQFRLNTATTTAQNSGDRAMQGMGFSGEQRQAVAGWG